MTKRFFSEILEFLWSNQGGPYNALLCPTRRLSECKTRRGASVQLQHSSEINWVLVGKIYYLDTEGDRVGRRCRLRSSDRGCGCEGFLCKVHKPWPKFIIYLSRSCLWYLGLRSFPERPQAGFMGDIICISDQVMLPDCIVFPRIPSISKKASASDLPCGSTWPDEVCCICLQINSRAYSGW